MKDNFNVSFDLHTILGLTPLPFQFVLVIGFFEYLANL